MGLLHNEASQQVILCMFYARLLEKSLGGFTVECECDGTRIVCNPKSKEEEALDIRHLPDCIAGCECNPLAAEAKQDGKVTNLPADDTQ